jgi:hypothetical protein
MKTISGNDLRDRLLEKLKMEPSQINHLREAAVDIRNSIQRILNIADTIDGEDVETDKALLNARVNDIERALTRIEMCLKEVK